MEVLSPIETAPVFFEHANGDIFMAESLGAARDVCVAAGKLSLGEFAALIELQTIGRGLLADAPPPPPTGRITKRPEKTVSTEKPDALKSDTVKKVEIATGNVVVTVEDIPTVSTAIRDTIVEELIHRDQVADTEPVAEKLLLPAETATEPTVVEKPTTIKSTSAPQESGPDALDVLDLYELKPEHSQEEHVPQGAAQTKLPLMQPVKPPPPLHKIDLPKYEEVIAESKSQPAALPQPGEEIAAAKPDHELEVVALDLSVEPQTIIPEAQIPETLEPLSFTPDYLPAYDLEPPLESPGELTSLPPELLLEEDYITALETPETPQPLPTPAAPFEQIETVMHQITAALETETAEDETSQKISSILWEIVTLPDDPKAPEVANEEIIDQKLEELFVELFEAVDIEYSPDILESFIYLTKSHYLEKILKVTPKEEGAIQGVPDQMGTREFLQKLQRILGSLKQAINYACEIGRSALKLSFARAMPA